MIRKYVYNEKEYFSAYAVKQAIFEAERLAFEAEPDEGKAEFWAQYGVTYTEEPEPEPSLEDVRSQKLNELEDAFLNWYEKDATMISSLGFECDSDARAKMDVDGLVTKAQAEGIEDYSTTFMDAKNQPHLIGFEELKTIQLEIIDSGLAVYNQKWAMRTAINAAETVEELEAIEIKFTKQDFSTEVDA